MKIESFTASADFDEDKIVTKVLMESPFSKEIRILMKQGQVMKEHTAPLPIIVHILEGKINFGINGTVHVLQRGDIISLMGGVPHNLVALNDSVVRLSLSKNDQAKRVEDVAASK